MEYAKTKSDAVAKLDGTWRKDLRTRKEVIGAVDGLVPMDEDVVDEEGDQGERNEGRTTRRKSGANVKDVGEPHNVLFAEDLPEATNETMLGVLFKQFPGFVEARMVPGKPGIAFIEFEGVQQAGVAITGLQGFKITPKNQMNLTYAKK